MGMTRTVSKLEAPLSPKNRPVSASFAMESRRTPARKPSSRVKELRRSVSLAEHLASADALSKALALYDTKLETKPSTQNQRMTFESDPAWQGLTRLAECMASTEALSKALELYASPTQEENEPLLGRSASAPTTPPAAITETRPASSISTRSTEERPNSSISTRSNKTRPATPAATLEAARKNALRSKDDPRQASYHVKDGLMASRVLKYPNYPVGYDVKVSPRGTPYRQTRGVPVFGPPPPRNRTAKRLDHCSYVPRVDNRGFSLMGHVKNTPIFSKVPARPWSSEPGKQLDPRYYGKETEEKGLFGPGDYNVRVCNKGVPLGFQKLPPRPMTADDGAKAVAGARRGRKGVEGVQGGYGPSGYVLRAIGPQLLSHRKSSRSPGLGHAERAVYETLYRGRGEAWNGVWDEPVRFM